VVAAYEAKQHQVAERAWQLATSVGDRSAEYNLGLLLEELGRQEEAERWFRRAADAGLHGAEYNLGLLLQQRGDLEEAEQWYRRAAESGDQDALRALAQLRDSSRSAVRDADQRTADRDTAHDCDTGHNTS
jgi:TPR repeat protein